MASSLLALIAASVAGQAYSSEATTLFAAMSSQPDAAHKGYYDTFIKALKVGAISGSDIWSGLDVFQFYAAGDTQQACLNWKNPGVSNTATLVNSVTFTADRGIAGNGSTSYIHTQFAPSNGVQLLQNSASYSIWSRTAGQEANTGNGCANAIPSRASIAPRNASDQCGTNNNENTGIFVSNTDGSGLFSSVRTGASAGKIYRNGSSLGNIVATSVGRPTTSYFVGAFNNNGTPASYSTRQWALFAAGKGRTDNEELDFYNACQALMTAIGA